MQIELQVKNRICIGVPQVMVTIAQKSELISACNGDWQNLFLK
jgi:hypothetical protein